MGKMVSQKKRSEFLWGWLFVLPTFIGLMVLNIIPIFQTIWESFFKTGAFGRGNKFVGFGNYLKMFADESVWQALLNTFKYAVVEVPLSIAIAVVIAVLLNRHIFGKTTYRIIYFLPMVAAPAAVSMVWRWLYNSEFGLLNYFLRSLGFTPANYLSNPSTTFFFIALVGVWTIIGYNMVLFLAGLQEIPTDYYEAAEIDGASKIRQFFSITLPLLSPTMFFVTITRIIAALQVFDTIYVMLDITSPSFYKTQSLVYLFYKYSFIQSNRGYGSAIVMLLLLVIIVITLIQMRMQKKWVAYN